MWPRVILLTARAHTTGPKVMKKEHFPAAIFEARFLLKAVSFRQGPMNEIFGAGRLIEEEQDRR